MEHKERLNIVLDQLVSIEWKPLVVFSGFVLVPVVRRRQLRPKLHRIRTTIRLGFPSQALRAMNIYRVV